MKEKKKKKTEQPLSSYNNHKDTKDMMTREHCRLEEKKIHDG
jgi:hypothetical protein